MYHKSIHSMSIIVGESFEFPIIARVCIITVVQKSGLCIYTVKVLGSIFRVPNPTLQAWKSHFQKVSTLGNYFVNFPKLGRK